MNDTQLRILALNKACEILKDVPWSLKGFEVYGAWECSGICVISINY